MATLDRIFGEKAYESMLDAIMQTPHTPTLTAVKEVDGKLLVEEIREDGRFYVTDREVEAEQVGDFCYIEEESFDPIKKRCQEQGLDLDAIEIDTKLLRTRYFDLDFDAYSFYPPGAGLNIDGLTRISGKLYKIKN